MSAEKQQSLASLYLPAELPFGMQSGGVLATVLSVIAVVLWLRRRVSRDGLEMTKDHSEKTLIEKLREERDKALSHAEEAWGRRTDDAAAIAKLTSEVGHLSANNFALTQHVVRLEEKVTQLSRLIAQFAPSEVGQLFGKDTNQTGRSSI
jgi:hypothetical protein